MEIGPSSFWPSGLALFQACPRTPSFKVHVFAIQRGCCPKISSTVCNTCTPSSSRASHTPSIPSVPWGDHETRNRYWNKKLSSDKSPGDDEIANCMIPAVGLKFQELVYEMFDTLWTHGIQPTAWQMSLMQPICEGGNKFKADSASYLAHIWAVRWLNFLREFWFLSWPNLQKPTVHSQKTNLELDLADRSNIVCPQAIIQYNIIQKGLATYVAFCDFSTRPLSQASTKEKSFHYCAKKTLQEECGSISEKGSCPTPADPKK